MNLQEKLEVFPKDIKTLILDVISLMRQYCMFTIANEAGFVIALCEGYEEYGVSYLGAIAKGINIYTKNKYYRGGKAERYLLAIINNMQNERKIRFELEQKELDNVPPEEI